MPAGGLHFCLTTKTKQKRQGCFWLLPCVFIKLKFGRVISSPTWSFPLSLKFYFNSGQPPKEAVHLCNAAALKQGLGRRAGKQAVTALKNYCCPPACRQDFSKRSGCSHEFSVSSLLQVGAKTKSRHFVGGKDESRRQAESSSSSLAVYRMLNTPDLRVIRYVIF